jgi:hypothetical protein
VTTGQAFTGRRDVHWKAKLWIACVFSNGLGEICRDSDYANRVHF